MPTPLWPGGFSSPPAFDNAPTVTLVTPNAGSLAGGDSITITGTNFRGGSVAPGVTIGGVAATNVVVVDRNTITCTTPAGTAGLVNVQVTVDGVSPAGQTATLAGGFTYWSAVIKSVSPAFGPLAGGTRVMVFGYNFNENSKPYFGGVAAAQVSFIDASHISCVTPNHAVGFVDVTLKSPTNLFAPGIFDAGIFNVIAQAQTTYATLKGAFQYTLLNRGADFRRMPSINIHRAINNTNNQATLVIDGNSNVPVTGEELQIVDALDGNRLLFAGNVQTVEQDFDGVANPALGGRLKWKITVVDFSWLLNRRRPFGTYANVSASTIVIDLINKFAPGFTTAHVQTSLAKISITIDGSKDLITVLNDIAGFIGGGHWYVDFNQDVHFFHRVPANLAVPGSGMTGTAGLGTLSAAHLTVTEGATFGNTFNFHPGYYYFRHTFVYSDGSESALQAISNPVFLSGVKRLSFANIPLGVAPPGLTVAARRIYYNVLQSWPLEMGTNGLNVDHPLTVPIQFCQVNDNTTTAFTTWFGTTGASSTAVIAIPTGTQVPLGISTVHPVGPTVPATLTTQTVLTGNGAVINFLSAAVKVAFLYRDGSLSYVGPASNTSSLPGESGLALQGWSLANIPIGPSVGTMDVVARVIWMGFAGLTNPNALNDEFRTLPASQFTPGFIYPNVAYNAVDWARVASSGSVIFVPDNTSTVLNQFYAGQFLNGPTPTDAIGSLLFPGILVGSGIAGYDNSAANALSTDPIPIWPNPDGPSLEDNNPPTPVDDNNAQVLYDPHPIQSIDTSQVRNRIFVIGSGGTVLANVAAGDVVIYVNDVAAFSPSGGKVRIIDVGNLKTTFINYVGVTGTQAKAGILLAQGAPNAIAQGSIIHNFFQADDTASQRLLGAVELDKNGNPTDGIHEYTVVDGSLKAQFQLFMRANAELELFSRPIVTVNYSTRDPKSLPGQIVHFALSNPPINGDFLIQEVTIDQIHDESDQASPRYNVVASSVRYDLNDLLLAILAPTTSGSAGGGGISTAGLVAAAAVSAQAVPVGTNVPGMGRRNFAMANATVNEPDGAALESYGLGAIGQALTGSTTLLDTQRAWKRLSSSNSAGGQWATNNAPGIVRFDWDPYFQIRIRTGASIAPQRVWVGWPRIQPFNSTSDAPPNNDNLLVNSGSGNNLRFIGLRFSSAAGFFWTAIVADGLDANTVATGGIQNTANFGAVLPNTEYLLECSVSHGSATATFTVTPGGGGAAVAQVVAIPSSMFGNPYNINVTNITNHLYVEMFSNDASTRTLDIGGIYCEWGRV